MRQNYKVADVALMHLERRQLEEQRRMESQRAHVDLHWAGLIVLAVLVGIGALWVNHHSNGG